MTQPGSHRCRGVEIPQSGPVELSDSAGDLGVEPVAQCNHAGQRAAVDRQLQVVDGFSELPQHKVNRTCVRYEMQRKPFTYKAFLTNPVLRACVEGSVCTAVPPRQLPARKRPQATSAGTFW